MASNLRLIQQSMQGKHEAILLTDPVSRRYAAGFASSAGMALIFKKAAYFLTDFRYFGMAQAAITEFELIQISREQPAATIISELLFSHGITTLSYENLTLTHKELMDYRKKIKVKACSLGDFLERLMCVKSAEELQRIQHAQAQCEAVLTEILPFLREGVSDLDIKAEIYYRILKHGLEDVSFAPIVAVGAASALPHASPCGLVIKAGDVVTIDMGGVFQGLCSDMTRTFAIGKADPLVQKVYATVLDAQSAALDALCAGMPFEDIDAAARRVIAAAGYGEYFGHLAGHGIGLRVHENLFASRKEGGLSAGSVVTVEPGIYLPGQFGVRIEDLCCVTEDGHVNMTRFSKELLIL